eukprot:scaffold83685_cov36-Phaeocystis_antarctica.AAC.1
MRLRVGVRVRVRARWAMAASMTGRVSTTGGVASENSANFSRRATLRRSSLGGNNQRVTARDAPPCFAAARAWRTYSHRKYSHSTAKVQPKYSHSTAKT